MGVSRYFEGSNTYRRAQKLNGQGARITPFMSVRLTPFSTDETAALLFTLDIAATVEQPVPEAEQLRQELIAELKERADSESEASL